MKHISFCSVRQTLRDLKRQGGGTVILITDGEETCKGDPKAAADQELVEKVKVIPGPNTVLRVVLKDNRFVIER